MEDFAHKLLLDRIGDGDRIDVSASEAERHSIRDRLGLQSLEKLDAHATLAREGGNVRARGRIRASLEQSCIATGEPVAEHIDEPFEVIFVPEPSSASPDDEIELAGEDCDVVFFDGSSIDLGAAIADTLALAMNPYPRSAGADAALKDAGVMSEEQASPFAVLAKLRKGSEAD